MPAYFFQPRGTLQLLRGHAVLVSCFRGHAARGRYTDLPAFSMTCVLVTSHLTLCALIMEHADATPIVDTFVDLFLLKYTCRVACVDHVAR